MNPIQRAWLKVLQPVSFLLNEKLAKRSGIFGKIGRFFAIGPREFGVHPTTRILRAGNKFLVYILPTLFHSEPFWRGMTQRGYTQHSPFRWFTIVRFAAGYALLSLPFFYDIYQDHDASTNLEIANNEAGGVALPYSALNYRHSAHFLEINSIYGAEMARRFEHKAQQIRSERNGASDKDKKTKYAIKGYNYVQAPAAIYQ